MRFSPWAGNLLRVNKKVLRTNRGSLHRSCMLVAHKGHKLKDLPQTMRRGQSLLSPCHSPEEEEGREREKASRESERQGLRGRERVRQTHRSLRVVHEVDTNMYRFRHVRSDSDVPAGFFLKDISLPCKWFWLWFLKLSVSCRCLNPH